MTVPAPGPVDTISEPGGLRLLPFYLGGFLGPFGTLVIVPMLPDLRDHFEVDSATISWSLSAYLFPMAVLMLVSGTIGERLGRVRVLRASLAVYVVGSVLVAVAPALGPFLAARALQGAANAFFTPLLLAGLADITAEGRLGRRVGMYTSFQAVGGALAPFAGGLAAEVDWRLAFWATAVVSVVILASTPRSAGRVATGRVPIRALIDGRLLALAGASFASTAGPLGSAVLVGFKVRDDMGLEPGPAGLLLAGGYVGSILLGPTFGRLLDRYGPRWCGAVSILSVGLAVAAIGPVDAVAGVTALYLLAGSLVGFVTVVLHQVAAAIMPDNRGGALSAVLSFRFLGLAVSPLIWVPVLTRSVPAAFAGSALLSLVTLGALLVAVRPGSAASGVGAGSPARRTSSPVPPGSPGR